eukprot:SAG31_NODE_8901_length_1366_cov_1.288082_1_plen_109_part_00
MNTNEYVGRTKVNSAGVRPYHRTSTITFVYVRTWVAKAPTYTLCSLRRICHHVGVTNEPHLRELAIDAEEELKHRFRLKAADSVASENERPSSLVPRHWQRKDRHVRR